MQTANDSGNKIEIQIHNFSKFFLEFYELATSRTEADLRIQITNSDAMLNALKERLSHHKSGPYSELYLLAKVLTSPLESILENPNYRLFRFRQMMQLSRAKQMDAACVRWLARQPGKTIHEKTGGKQKVLAVQRRFTVNTLENRVVKYLVERLIPDAMNLRLEENLECVESIKRFRTVVKSWQHFVKGDEIGHLKGMPAPNNSLRHDRDYRRIWLGIKRILSKETRIKGTTERFTGKYVYWVAQIIGLAMSRSGLSPLDIGFMLTEGETGFLDFHDCCGVWLLDNGQRWGRYELHIIDQRIKLLFLDSSNSNNEISEIEFQYDFVGTHIKILKENNDWSFSADWENISECVNSLTKYLSNVLNLPSINSTKEVPVLERTYSKSLIMCICNDSLILADNVTSSAYPVCAGEVNVVNNRKTSQMTVTGKVARALLIEHSRKKWLNSKAHDDFRVGIKWLTHGYLWETISKHRKIYLLTALFHSSLRRQVKFDECVFVYPQHLQELAYHNLYSSILHSGVNCLMLPQPVATAFHFAKFHPEKLQVDGKFLFVNLDGEMPDVGYLEYHKCNDNTGEGEWIRFFMSDKLEFPSNLKWSNMAIQNACERQKISLSKSQRVRIFLKTSHDEMMQVGFGAINSIKIYFQEDCKEISCLEIVKDDIAKSWDEYIKILHEQLALFLKKVSHNIKDYSIIIACSFIKAENIQSKLLDNITYISEESIISGARIFLERKKEGLPTWKDHLPELKLKVNGDDRSPVWHVLFAEKKPVEIGKTINGKEYQFIFPAGRKFVSLPLEKDGHRSSFDPVIRVKQPLQKPLRIYLHANYQGAGSGLEILYRSEDPEIIAPDCMNWEHIPRIVSDEPEFFYRESLSLASDEFKGRIDAFNILFNNNFAMNGGTNGENIIAAVESIDEYLKHNLTLSEASPWQDITNKYKESLAKTIFHIACLSDMGTNNLSSSILNNIDFKKYNQPHGNNAINLLTLLRVNQRFNRTLFNCLGRLRLAAPNIFIEKIISTIRSGTFPVKNDVTKYLHAAARIAGSYEISENHSLVIKYLLGKISNFADEKTIDYSFRSWSWAVGTFLRSSEKAAESLPVELSVKTFNDVLRLFRILCEGETDKGTWRDFLFMFISFRHCTRAQDGKGMSRFGPESELVKTIVKTLNEANKLLAEHNRLEIVNEIKRRSLGIDDTEKFATKGLLDQLCEIWQGKVTVLLKQEKE